MGKFIGFVILLLLGVILGQFLFNMFYSFPKNIYYGVSFSPKFASQLKMDWKLIFISILDDLKVRNLRLPTYWDVLEPGRSKYNFSDTDFMLDEASKRGAKVILTLGARQYRWPECYIPNFAKTLSVEDREQKILEFIQAVVEKYKSNPVIVAWQLENEPLLEDFGEGCDRPDREFLKSEVELVRGLDKRPIMITDSGELGWWVTSMKLSDIFGTTVYRRVYNKFFGFIEYPILPYFYNIKSALVRSFFAKNNQKTIISELQAEPWSPTNNLVNTNPSEQVKLFSLDKFKDNMDFAKGTGFDEVYLWGVEWWYFMKDQNHPEYWDFAKSLFEKSLFR